MVAFAVLRKLALSFPETKEAPHFGKISFRVNKKIFATYDESNGIVSLKLSAVDQNVFSTADRTAIYPVDNKWGKQGWTLIETRKVNKDLFADALTAAYCQVAPKKLATQVRPNVNE